MFDIIKEVIGWIWKIFDNQRKVRFTVHRAFFGNGKECFFLNVTNLLKERKIEVTHIWFEANQQIAVMQKDRPLPKRLEPDETWETWIEVRLLPEFIISNPYKTARLRLSTGKVIKSKENIGVPTQGTVPGGPITQI